FTLYILVGMAAGLIAGALVHALVPAPAGAKAWADGFSLVTDVFLRLIKMIIAPLVLSTLTVGIAHMGQGSAVGRIGGRAIGWFVGAGVASLIIGMVVSEIVQPGAGLHMSAPPADAAGAPGVATSLSAKGFLEHVFPASVTDAMARNEILQIVVFAVFLGLAVGAIGERGRPLLLGLESLAQAMLKVTNYVMSFAPLAVFAAIAAAVSTQGLGVLATYAKFVGGFYLALAVLWGALILAGGTVVGMRRARGLFAMIRQPALLAFSTATSEAAYPRTLEELERFGVSNRIASFVLPLGYSFNLDGSMMYCTFASLFIAQVYGVHLTLGQRGLMLLLLGRDQMRFLDRGRRRG
ncbi:MAG: hypothetical protein Q9168_006721, partial [Polycauliona sp. 1 TL-2023]